ncbi:MAG: hypothetical protein ACLTWK_12145 [Eisenbergiella sp.]
MPLPFKKLKNLAEMVNISDADIMVAEDTDTTRKMTIRQLIMYIKNHAELNKHFATSENLNQSNAEIEQLKKVDQNIQAEVSKHTKKLSGIEDGANKYIHPSSSGNKHIPSGGSAGKILGWSSDGTAKWVDDKNTTYANATTSKSGLMSSADKAKLDTIEDGANNYSLPSASPSVKGGVTIGDNITVNNGRLSLTKENVTNALGFVPGTGDGGVEYITGTETVSGITKLYGKSGQNIDGALTQKAASDMITSVNSEISALKSSDKTLESKISEAASSSGFSLSSTDGNINLISKGGNTLSSVKIPTTREVISSTEPSGLSNDDYWTQAY